MTRNQLKGPEMPNNNNTEINQNPRSGKNETEMEPLMEKQRKRDRIQSKYNQKWKSIKKRIAMGKDTIN